MNLNKEVDRTKKNSSKINTMNNSPRRKDLESNVEDDGFVHVRNSIKLPVTKGKRKVKLL